jgi:hypothetical protein
MSRVNKLYSNIPEFQFKPLTFSLLPFTYHFFLLPCTLCLCASVPISSPSSHCKYLELFSLFTYFFIKHSPKRYLFITIAYEKDKNRLTTA